MVAVCIPIEVLSGGGSITPRRTSVTVSCVPVDERVRRFALSTSLLFFVRCAQKDFMLLDFASLCSVAKKKRVVMCGGGKGYGEGGMGWVFFYWWFCCYI